MIESRDFFTINAQKQKLEEFKSNEDDSEEIICKPKFSIKQ
jgi:hypothetical protein